MAGHVLVIDIGKTNAKLALVDTSSASETAVVTRPSRVLPGPPYPHLDVHGIWAFVLAGGRKLSADRRIDGIVVAAHGATAALVDAAGNLALPVLDYEHVGPNEVAKTYDPLRPSFGESGSPRLSAGLNLGAQLFWQFATFPEARQTTTILTWPQYWAYRLSGVASIESSSLGCHTDLWNPHRRDFSTLVDAQSWRRLMPPVRASAEVLGPVNPDVAEAMRLPADTPVLCGIHDSNASLLPHLNARPAPFAVVSTGTWVVAMAVGGDARALDPARDTLINVSAFGDPVPSARFMGGREWSLLMAGRRAVPTPADRAAVLARRAMLLPSVESDSGPFAGRVARWTIPEEALSDGERAVVSSHYLALMTRVCLEDVGAAGPVVIEGPFAANPDYCGMLASAIGRAVIPSAAGTGTSLGAAALAGVSHLAPDAAPFLPDPGQSKHAIDWDHLLQSPAIDSRANV